MFSYKPTQQDLDDKLCHAIEKEKLKAIESALTAGGNVNYEEGYPLRLAVALNNFNILNFLIEKGGDIHLKDDEVLPTAVSKNYLEMVRFLHKAGAKSQTAMNRALCTAAERGYLEMAHFLIEEGAEVSANGEALKNAARQGQLEFVRLLIKHNVDARAQDYCALRISAKYKDKDMQILDCIIDHLFDPQYWIEKRPSSLQAESSHIVQLLKDCPVFEGVPVSKKHLEHALTKINYCTLRTCQIMRQAQTTPLSQAKPAAQANNL